MKTHPIHAQRVKPGALKSAFRLQSLWAASVKPCLARMGVKVESHARVAQWGRRLGWADEWLFAGANVVGLASSDQEAAEWKASQFRYHHTVDASPSTKLATLGLGKERLDLFFVEENIPQSALTQVANEVFRALDEGGVGVWPLPSEFVPAVTEVWRKHHAFTVEVFPLAEERLSVVVAQKGERQARPQELLSLLSRTSCVDRQAVLQAFEAPLVEGVWAPPDSRLSAEKIQSWLRREVQKLEEKPHLPAERLRLPPVSRTTVESLPQALCDVLVLIAHPDDEVGFAGGTLARACQEGAALRIVSMTGGEGGQSQKSSKEPLKNRRWAETQEVAARFQAQAFEVLDLEDFGKYRDVQRSQPVTAGDALETWGVRPTLEKMVYAIRKHRPRHVLTFAPTHDPDFALHGHHLALGKAALLAFHLAGDPSFAPQTLKDGLRVWVPESHWAAVAPHHKGHPRVLSLAVDVQAKRQALEAYGSQLYSLEEYFKALEKRRPHVLEEHWHCVQSRLAPLHSRRLEPFFSLGKQAKPNK